MPDVMTHADSIRMYLTGAASDGGVQTDNDLSLGNYRSSTEVSHISASIASPISNITVDFISGANSTGTGTLTATGSDTLTWTPPGGSAGSAVTILNGESKLLEGSGAPQKFIRVTRTSATALSGTATLTLTNVYNNVIGFDNVSSAEAAAGDVEYRCVMLKNLNSVAVKNLYVYVATLGTQLLSGSTQLGASGLGTIAPASGNFSDWPSSGFCRIENSGGTLKEIVYYSSRTNSALTVPSGGRGQLGTSATAGAATDFIYPVPGIRIGKETVSSSHVQTIANESAVPSGVTFVTGITTAAGVNMGDVAANGLIGLWIERTVVASATAVASVLNKINLSFDAA